MTPAPRASQSKSTYFSIVQRKTVFSNDFIDLDRSGPPHRSRDPARSITAASAGSTCCGERPPGLAGQESPPAETAGGIVELGGVSHAFTRRHLIGTVAILGT